MNGNKRDTPTEWIDPDDAPELTDEWFEEADLMIGDKVVRRGRPKSEAPKRLVTLRLDPDVLDRFRASGPGWRTRINAALRSWLKTHKPA